MTDVPEKTVEKMVHPITETDRLIRERGFDLVGEYTTAVEFAAFDRNECVLDVATGSGRMACVLADRGYEVWSGDISEEALEKARLRLGDLVSRVKLLTFDAAAIPFESGSFSAITCANAIHEMEDPHSVLQEMVRLVSDNGKLVLIEFNDEGFNLLAEIHSKLGRAEHRRGIMTESQIDTQLRALFVDVSTSDLGINRLWVASGKR